MCCECCSVTQRKAWVFGSGTILAALGIVLVVLWPDLANDIVDKNLLIVEGSSAYESWVHAPIPIYLEFHMFNWTNPEDFYNPNTKPRFEELGPYVYLEQHFKENITHYENQTVSYYERRIWTFDAERSNGSEHDMITMLHPVTATVADDMRKSNKYIKKVVNFMLNREGGHLYVTKPVYQWTFEGFQDDLSDFLRLFNTSKIHIPYQRFGFLAERNGTLDYDGLFTMYTGEGDIRRLAHLTNWNGSPETGYYEAPCGTVNGTTGDSFPPYTDPNAEMTVFVTDACRFLNLSPNGTLVHRGVEGVQYVGTIETLDSGENFPDQQCFCNPLHEECPKTGVVDCKKCRDNAPIYSSFPHFYLADESYLNAVEGMNPVKEIHEFKLTVEPRTGIPVKINGRIQINLMVQPDDEFDIYRGVPHILMPLFWFEQKAELDKDSAAQARLALNLPSYGVWAGITLISLGAVFYIVAIVLTVTKKWKRTPQDDEDVLSN